ncbi:MAG: lipase family protein [Planctomycetota bacterium]
MPVLDPLFAGEVADAVYTIKNTTHLKPDRNQKPSPIYKHFDFSNGDRVTGRSGGRILASRNGFGVIAHGSSTATKHEAVVAFRGTTLGFDYYTDASVGMQLPGGSPRIHLGFQRVFDSLRGQLDRHFRKDGKNIQTIHCIGHSLGGAIATLAANHISKSNYGRAILYTFGSPRVGNQTWAGQLTAQLGAANIYRVYHRSDVVSMVPMWPFCPVPQPGCDYYLHSPGMVPGIRYHLMDPSYLRSIAGKTWPQLARPPIPEPFDAKVQQWLASSKAVQLTGSTVPMIYAAMKYCLRTAGIGIQELLIGPGTTVIDTMAMALAKAARVNVTAARWVTALIGKIMQACGKGIHITGDMTVGFLRWVLQRFASQIASLTRAAIQAVHKP